MRITTAREKPPGDGFSNSLASDSRPRGSMPSRPARSPARRRSRPGRSSTTSRPRRRSPRRSSPRPWPRPTPPSTPGSAAGIRWRRSSSGSWPPSYAALWPHRNYPAPVLETALGPLATRRGNIGEAMRREHLGNSLFTPRGELGLIDLARVLGRCYLRGRPSAALEIRGGWERRSSSTGSGPEWTCEPSGTRNAPRLADDRCRHSGGPRSARPTLPG